MVVVERSCKTVLERESVVVDIGIKLSSLWMLLLGGLEVTAVVV